MNRLTTDHRPSVLYIRLHPHPVMTHSGGVDGHSLLRRDIGPVLEVVMLPLLLGLKVQAGETAQVLAAHLRIERRRE